MKIPIRVFLAVLLLALAGLRTTAQVLFRDDFNRAALTTGAPSTYTTTVYGGDGDALLSGGTLQLTNDGSSATNAVGRVAVTGLSGVSMLSASQTTLCWTFNARTNRTTNPGGFDSNLYSLAVVLGATGGDLTQASGYAIAYGNAGTPDPIRLVHFTGGLDADTNLTTLVSSGAADLSTVSNYFSVKVLYTPNTDTWQLYLRDDGPTAWSDPATTGALIGTATDATYATTPLTHFGFLWNYNTAAGQLAQFDNFQLAAIPEPPTALIFLAGIAIIFVGLGRLSRA
jgi:trimeric autotransporter adhesin